jgi:hypothetical protein
VLCTSPLQGGASRADASWQAAYPSRWLPDYSGSRGAAARQHDLAYELVDHLLIPKRRPPAGAPA